MRRLHVGLWLAGGVVLLLSLPAQWWQVVLVTGLSLPVRGVELSALAAALVAVSAASFGAGLLFRGVIRRVVAGISASSAIAAGLALLSAANHPERAVVDAITQLTGVSGVAALDSVAVVNGGGWLFVALGGAVLMGVGGLCGVLSPERVAGASRYERGALGVDPDDPVATWDTLSDGIDPTKR